MNAEQFCVNEGSHLVSIHNQQEYDFVKLIWRSMRNEHHVMVRNAYIPDDIVHTQAQWTYKKMWVPCNNAGSDYILPK